METITQTKICTKCKIEKELSFFSNKKAGKYGKRAYCKQCAKLSKTIWDNNNRDKISLQAKEWKLLNPEKQKEHISNYKKTVKYKEAKRIRKQSPEGKDSDKNYKHKRRSLTKQGDVTSAQILQLEYNAKVCYWCKCSLKNIKVHIDHYVPIAKGGLHTITNLVIACSKCNLSKNAKDPLKFANSIGRLL